MIQTLKRSANENKVPYWDWSYSVIVFTTYKSATVPRTREPQRNPPIKTELAIATSGVSVQTMLSWRTTKRRCHCWCLWFHQQITCSVYFITEKHVRISFSFFYLFAYLMRCYLLFILWAELTLFLHYLKKDGVHINKDILSTTISSHTGPCGKGLQCELFTSEVRVASKVSLLYTHLEHSTVSLDRCGKSGSEYRRTRHLDQVFEVRSVGITWLTTWSCSGPWLSHVSLSRLGTAHLLGWKWWESCLVLSGAESSSWFVFWYLSVAWKMYVFTYAYVYGVTMYTSMRLRFKLKCKCLNWHKYLRKN